MTPHNPIINRIISTVCKRYGLTRVELLSRARPNRIAWPRMVAMWLCWELSGLSIAGVGREFGRDFDTVRHARKRVKDIASVYPRELEAVEAIRKELEKPV